MAGRGIEDKGGWPASSDAMMASSNKNKRYESAEGAGGIMDYPDTTEDVKRDQSRAESHIKSRKMKPGNRY